MQTGNAPALFRCLTALYDHPPRAYHNLTHVRDLLSIFDEDRSLVRSADAVEFAIWLHDCVFVAGREDNEILSADVARAFLTALRSEKGFASGVAEMILATRHDGPASNPDAQLTADVDLAMLAVSRDQFQENGRRLRSEYTDFNDAQFQEGRRSFIERFLARPFIYQTTPFREKYEAAARVNLSREQAVMKS